MLTSLSIVLCIWTVWRWRWRWHWTFSTLLALLEIGTYWKRNEFHIWKLFSVIFLLFFKQNEICLRGFMMLWEYTIWTKVADEFVVWCPNILQHLTCKEKIQTLLSISPLMISPLFEFFFLLLIPCYVYLIFIIILISFLDEPCGFQFNKQAHMGIVD